MTFIEKSIRLQSVYIKRNIFTRKNEKFRQVIVSMFILTRSSEWIFNPMRYTGYLHVHRRTSVRAYRFVSLHKINPRFHRKFAFEKMPN